MYLGREDDMPKATKEAHLFGESRDEYNLPPAGYALVSSNLSPAQSWLQLHRDTSLKLRSCPGATP